MNDGKPLSISPKRHWTKEQWDIYRRMSLIGRMLVDVMLLMPGFSQWLAERALVYEKRRKALEQTPRGRGSIRASWRLSSSASRPSLRSLREP